MGRANAYFVVATLGRSVDRKPIPQAGLITRPQFHRQACEAVLPSSSGGMSMPFRVSTSDAIVVEIWLAFGIGAPGPTSTVFRGRSLQRSFGYLKRRSVRERRRCSWPRGLGA